MSNDIGKEVYRIRINANLSQRQFASIIPGKFKAHSSISLIHKIENGYTLPSKGFILTLSKMLGKEADVLCAMGGLIPYRFLSTVGDRDTIRKIWDTISNMLDIPDTAPEGIPFINSTRKEREIPKTYQYEDTGCEFAPKCTECPFPKCLQEDR